MSTKNEFIVNRLPILLMSESTKKEKRLSTMDDGIQGINVTGDGFGSYYDLPQHLDLNSHSGASKSFGDYMKENGKPHPSMILAAHNVAQAYNYLTSELFKTENFDKHIFKHTVHSIKNAFNALQKIGQQHKHSYLSDMLDDAHHKHNAYNAAMGDGNVSIGNTYSNYTSNDKGALVASKTGKQTAGKDVMMEGFIDDTAGLSESDRSEFSANMALDDSPNKGGVDFHHIFVKNRATGKRKSIAGPFPTAEHAMNHPARPFGDGVCTGAMCENVLNDDGVLMSEAGEVYGLSKVFYNSRAGKYMQRKVKKSQQI